MMSLPLMQNKAFYMLKVLIKWPSVLTASFVWESPDVLRLLWFCDYFTLQLFERLFYFLHNLELKPKSIVTTLVSMRFQAPSAYIYLLGILTGSLRCFRTCFGIRFIELK